MIIPNECRENASYTPAEPCIPPEGTIEITENGLVDVAQFANANVNVSGGGGEVNIKTLSPMTSDGGQFVISGLEAEPRAFFLTLKNSGNISSSSGKKIVAVDSVNKITSFANGNTQVDSAPFTFFGTARLTYEYANGTLTINILNDSAVGSFYTSTTKSYYYFTYIY